MINVLRVLQIPRQHLTIYPLSAYSFNHFHACNIRLLIIICDPGFNVVINSNILYLQNLVSNFYSVSSLAQ